MKDLIARLEKAKGPDRELDFAIASAVRAPRGWIEVSYVDTSQPDIYRHRRWHDRTARAGLYITDDLWIRLVARYAPTLRVARTFYKWAGGDGILEPVREDWNQPKLWWVHEQRAARSAA